MITYLPENNPFIKDNFSKKIKLANEHMAESRLFINKSNKIRDLVVKKLIEHIYFLVPNTEKYKDHYEFVHKVHTGTIFPSNKKIQKELLEIFILQATHAGFNHNYDGFRNNDNSFYTFFRAQENRDGRRAETLRREKILNELNELIKDVGEFLWFTDANETGAQVSFRLNDK